MTRPSPSDPNQSWLELMFLRPTQTKQHRSVPGAARHCTGQGTPLVRPLEEDRYSHPALEVPSANP